MRSWTSLVLAIFGLALASLCAAQNVAWRSQFSETSFCKLSLDANGNVYVLVRESSFSTSRARLVAFSNSGTQLYSKVIATESASTQFNFEDMEYTEGKLYIAFNSRNNGGFGSAVRGWLLAVDSGSGNVSWTRSDYSFFPVALAVVGEQIAAVGDFKIGGNFQFGFRWLTRSNGAPVADYYLSSATSIDDVAMGPELDAIAVGTGAGGKLMAARSTAQGVQYENYFESPQHHGQALRRVSYNPSNGKMYGLGVGYFNGGENDLDMIIIEFDRATGLNPIIKYYGGSTPDHPGALAVSSTGFVIVAGWSDSGGDGVSVVRRYNSGLTVGWTALTGGAGGYERYIGFDSQQNVFVADPRPISPSGQAVRVLKYVGGGVLDTTMNDNFQSNEFPTGLAIDADGNAFVVANGAGGAYVAKLQQAFLGVTNSTPYGGHNVTGSLNTSINAPVGGYTWQLTSSNPGAASVPASVTVPAGTNNKDFTITTFPVTADTPVQITASRVGCVQRLMLTVKQPDVASLSVTPTSVFGGVNAAASIVLTSKAPVGGQAVNLSSSNTSAATVPAIATVPANGNSVGFTVTTKAVSADTAVTLTAVTPGVSKTVLLTVKTPILSGLSVLPTTVVGGQSTTMTVSLSSIAFLGGVQVQTFSGAPGLVIVPSSVWVSVNQSSKAVPISTAAVSSTTPVVIFATRAGVYKTTTLTLTP